MIKLLHTQLMGFIQHYFLKNFSLDTVEIRATIRPLACFEILGYFSKKR